MLNNNFGEYVKSAMHYKELTKGYTNKICKILTDESPCGNIWYYRNGFFCVDVLKDDYDDYISFIEDLIGCSYCHVMNSNGLTFMVSLATLCESIQKMG